MITHLNSFDTINNRIESIKRKKLKTQNKDKKNKEPNNEVSSL